MIEPCPFCKFEQSDFRKSHNWQCTQCGKDYADWLLNQKTKPAQMKTKPVPKKAVEDTVTDTKKGFFSPIDVPLKAKPVELARSLFVLAIVGLMFLNFVAEGVFKWIYPLSIPLAGYYAFTMFKSGFAIGQHEVYQRDKNPFMYRIHFWSAIVLVFVALFAWLS